MPCASRFTQRKPHTRNNKGSQWLPLLSPGLHRQKWRCAPALEHRQMGR